MHDTPYQSTLKQQDGALIETIIINPQNETQSYCNRIIKHLNFGFVSTGTKVFLEIDIVNDGANPTGFGSPNSIYSNVFQSVEVDNIHLQVASKDKLAFYYNDRGQRVRKETYMYNDVEETIYVRDVAGNPIAIYHNPAGRARTRLKENPVYGNSRIGVFNRNRRTGCNYVYQLSDHLGNVRAVIMKSGSNAVSLTSKTDYYPFGMAMPDRNMEGGYRYGYQGEYGEKDPETGLNAFELRLWDSRIGRWLTTDPMGEFVSPYLGMGNNPIRLVDPDGASTEEPPLDHDFGNAPIYWKDSDGEWVWNNKTGIWEGMNGSYDIFGYSISLNEVVITQRTPTSLSTWATNQIGKTNWAFSKAKAPLPAKCNKCNLFIADGLDETNNGNAFYDKYPYNPIDANDYTGGLNLRGYTRVFNTTNEDGSKWQSLPEGFIQDDDILALRRYNGTAHLAIATDGGALSVGAGRDVVGKANNYMHIAAHGTWPKVVSNFSIWRKNK